MAAAFAMWPLTAQQTATYATVAGEVTDASGAVIQDAEVSARQTDTGITVTKKSDGTGRFTIGFLRSGSYELAVHKTGFRDATRTVTVAVGSAFDVPIVLAAASSSASIEVSGAPPVIETARTQYAATIGQSEIENLPLSGRSYFDAALMVPGVSPTNTASNQLFAETSAMPGQGISIGSQRNFSNSFVVDGVSANDDAAGVAGTFLGLDVIQELQVVTSGGQAELGRALGGFINVVTRSGGNALHGDLYGYLRNSRFNAANGLSHTVLPLTQAQYGSSVSGPIVKNRTFYFANFEGRALNQSGLTTISPANVATINARLLAVGYQGPQISTGNYSNPVHNQNFFGKVDHKVSASDALSAHYSLYHVSSYNSRGAGALSAPTASANLFDTDHSFALSNILTLSPHAVNETRVQFTNSNLAAPPSDPTGPAVSISGVATFGTLSGSPTGRLNRMLEVSDSLSIQHGANSFRAGVNYLYNNDTITFPRSIRGSYSFASLANFLTGTYTSTGFTQTFNATTVHQTNPNAGFYAQDEWRASSRLTFNIGLRYDLQFLQTIATRKANFSPRAGFAWTPFDSRKTVVRGSYGLFYDRIPLRALANALLSANNTANVANLRQLSVSFAPTQTGAPVFPNILTTATIPAGVFFNLSTMDPNMKNAYSEQGNFEIEQQITKNSTLSIGYEHVRGLHLIASVNQNVPTCAAAGTNDGCRPNLTYGNNSQYSPAADSHYDAGHISFIQRPAEWGAFRLSYTYSKALDDVGEFFFSSPMNNYSIWQDYSRADDDQRSRLTFDGSVHTSMKPASGAWGKISHGFQLSGSIAAYSPLPFNITTGSNTIQGTGARPTINGAFIGRNAGEGHAIINTSVRLSRTFALSERVKIQAIAEMFNALNHLNVVSLNGVFGTGAYPSAPSSTFGQITAVNDPRSGQFALKATF